MALLRLDFNAPGPVAEAFFRSRASVDAIMGPQGSAKTSTALWRLFNTGLEQAPHPVTKRREFSVCVLRDTYVRAWETIIPTWLEWFPKELGTFTGSDGRPATHRIRLKHPSGDGTVVDFLIAFLAIQDVGTSDREIENFFRGLNYTAFYLNEADLLAKKFLTYARGRAGRRPRRDVAVGFNGATWRGVLLDLNAPDIDNWIYKQFIDELPPGWGFYRQPSGMSPQAENVDNLVPGYYQEQIAGADEWWIRRFIHSEFGYSRDGKPVYPKYVDQVHVATTELVADRTRPLLLGFDAGLTPAMVVGQQDAAGRWLILDELCVDHGQMGPKAFGETAARYLAERFKDLQIGGAWGDPAAGAGEKAGEDQVWLNIVAKAMLLGQRIKRAQSNKLSIRLEAVKGPLTRMIDGGPGFVLSPRCRRLRKGFNSHYRYKRVAVAGTDRYHDEPDKNEFSHVHDALQYLLLGGGEYRFVMRGSDRRDDDGRTPPPSPPAPYDPYAWGN